MGKTLEELFSGLLDIVEHLVNTHNTWNGTLSLPDAKNLLAECRIGITDADAEIPSKSEDSPEN